MLECKCKICGRIISGVKKHYGGQSCAACAIFFNRSKNKCAEYFCGNEGLCLAIPSQSGIKCGKCRYQKCLEIGMRFPPKTAAVTKKKKKNNKIDNNIGKYLILAKELYGLFMTVTENPKLLINFFVVGTEVSLLNEEASKLAKSLSPIPSIRKWAKLFHKNQIPINEIYLLFYSILCCIKFPWLSFQDQQFIYAIQHLAVYQFLQPSAYSTPEIQEGFDKLTYFFQKEYSKIFVSKKFQETKFTYQLL